MRSDNDDSLDEFLGKPDYNDHLKTVRKRLALLSAPVPKDEPQPQPTSEEEGQTG